MSLLFFFLLMLGVKRTVILSANTVLGAKKEIDARNHDDKAKLIARDAENDLEEAKKALECTKITVNKALADLGKIRQFVDIVEEIYSTKHKPVKYGKINVNFEMSMLCEIDITSYQNQYVLKDDLGRTGLVSAFGVGGTDIAITGLRCCGNQCSFRMVWIGR